MAGWSRHIGPFGIEMNLLARNEDEPERMPGMPGSRGRHARQGEEPQRALGIPADWFGGVDAGFFRSFLHPISAYRRWSRRRRLGAYAVQDDTGRR